MSDAPSIFAKAGRHCRNLTDTEMAPGGPWMFKQADLQAQVVALAAMNKRARVAELANPAGQYFIYSCAEGVNAGQRITKTNPTRVVYALVVDYDFPFDEARIAEAFARQQALGLPLPHWIEISLSGQLHAIWFFEVPLVGPSEQSLWDAVLKRIAEIIGAKNFYPKMDSKSTSSSQIWTASGKGAWVFLDDAGTQMEPLISKAKLEGILDECVTEWAKESGDRDSEMTPERALPLIQKQWGDKFEWDGPFTEGALGPSFFVEGSTSPKSAHVKRNGIMSYSDHAREQGKTFYSWSDLIGPAAYELHKVAELPERLSGIWTDRKLYFLEPDGTRPYWRDEDKDGIVRYLKTKRGISTKPPKGKLCSPMEDALEFLGSSRRVIAATPIAFRPRGELPSTRNDGSKILNTSTGTVMAPEFPPEGRVWHWGPGGGFEDLCAHLEKFLPVSPDGVSQVDHLVAWIARFYKGAYRLDMDHGHVLVIVGPPGTGKTFFCEVILSPLFKLVAKAEQFLMGDSRFSQSLYASGLWVIDDTAKSSVDPVMLAARLKQELTQSLHVSEEKFQAAVQVEWKGRCAIFTNTDVDSLQVIPALDDGSNTAKFLLLRTSDADSGVDFHQSRVLADRIREQLPRFAAWLLSYELPEHLEPEERFGFKFFHHPDVTDKLELANQNFALVEYLRKWASAVARDEVMAGLDRVAYDQFELIRSIDSEWDNGRPHSMLSRQLYERRFPQRLTHLIETGKLPYLAHQKLDDGQRQWVLDLKMIRNLDGARKMKVKTL